MTDKILIGTTEDYGRIYLRKHSWNQGWFWGFGYLANKNCHYHMKSYLDGEHWEINKTFTTSPLTQENWYIILDLFKQAYALKEAAEIYQYGGHISQRLKNVTDIITNQGHADLLNHDLKVLLDTTWDYICNPINPDASLL